MAPLNFLHFPYTSNFVIKHLFLHKNISHAHQWKYFYGSWPKPSPWDFFSIIFFHIHAPESNHLPPVGPSVSWKILGFFWWLPQNPTDNIFQVHKLILENIHIFSMNRIFSDHSNSGCAAFLFSVQKLVFETIIALVFFKQTSFFHNFSGFWKEISFAKSRWLRVGIQNWPSVEWFTHRWVHWSGISSKQQTSFSQKENVFLFKEWVYWQPVQSIFFSSDARQRIKSRRRDRCRFFHTCHSAIKWLHSCWVRYSEGSRDDVRCVSKLINSSILHSFAGLLRDMIEGLDNSEPTVIPLCEVDGRTMKSVVAYLEYHCLTPPQPIGKPLKVIFWHLNFPSGHITQMKICDVICNWDQNFMCTHFNENPHEQLLHCARAANFLAIAALLELMCAVVGALINSQIRGQSDPKYKEDDLICRSQWCENASFRSIKADLNFFSGNSSSVNNVSLLLFSSLLIISVSTSGQASSSILIFIQIP